MTWIYFIVNAAAVACAGYLGWRTRRWSARRSALCLAVAAIVMALRGFLYAHPEYEQYLLRLSDDYLFFATWEAPIAVLMIFALAARLDGRRTRRLAATALIMLAPLFVWDSFAACLHPNYEMPAQFDEEGVCRQTTDYSCGPAAAVMMLKSMGEEISEGEMANLCLLRPGRGVTALELCRGLNIALRARNCRATVEHLNPGQLDRLDPPFLAEIKRPGSSEHCVVVLQVLADVVLLADPAAGRAVCTREEFLKLWTGIAVTVTPSQRSSIANNSPVALVRDVPSRRRHGTLALQR